MWFIEWGLRTYFILKRDRFLTTAIFTGSASTVHNSFKIMFQNFTFWCDQAMIHAYQCCVFRFWKKVLFLLQQDPKVRVNNSSEFFWLVETSQNERECVIRFVSLPHSVTCSRDKGIKARPDVFWNLNITLKYFLWLKKKGSIAMYFF